jgi:type III secretion system (T3SS) SseB-like protein
MPGTGLVGRIACVYDGVVDGPGLLAGLREAVVVVPSDGHDGVLTGDEGGVCWVYAFTGPKALARFAQARGEGDREWPYLTSRGARLLEVLPAIDRPAGIAVDVGSQRPVFFPPAMLEEGA